MIFLFINSGLLSLKNGEKRTEFNKLIKMERKHKVRENWGKRAKQSGMSMKGSKKGNSGGGSDDSSYEVEYIISEKKKSIHIIIKDNKFYYFVKWVGYP